MQSMNGEIALEHVFELMAGILNMSFEEQHLTQMNFFMFFVELLSLIKKGKMNFYMLESLNFVCPTLNVHNF